VVVEVEVVVEVAVEVVVLVLGGGSETAVVVVAVGRKAARPAAPPARLAPPVATVTAPTAPSSAATTNADSRSDRPLMPATILVVDDDPVILQLLRVNFEMEGFEVRTAADGEEALDAVRAEAPAVVVSDVMMPKLSGIDLTAKLKGDPATAGIPVLLLTAKAQHGDMLEGMAAGADDYVTKPFDPMALVERVQRLVAGPTAD
jgi:CheY-like chemotaxis protein